MAIHLHNPSWVMPYHFRVQTTNFGACHLLGECWSTCFFHWICRIMSTNLSSARIGFKAQDFKWTFNLFWIIMTNYLCVVLIALMILVHFWVAVIFANLLFWLWIFKLWGRLSYWVETKANLNQCFDVGLCLTCQLTVETTLYARAHQFNCHFNRIKSQ